MLGLLAVQAVAITTFPMGCGQSMPISRGMMELDVSQPYQPSVPPAMHLLPVCACASQIGGSGVLVQPMTYIFDEEPLRWQRLLAELGLEDTTGNDPAAAAAAMMATYGETAAAQEAAPARR